MLSKKGQISIMNAPTVIVIVGLTFLLMATVALVSESYQDALPRSSSGSIVNETVTPSATAQALSGSSLINSGSFSVSKVIGYNSTGALQELNTANYTVNSAAGTILNVSSDYSTSYNVSYTFIYTGTAGNITRDLNTEIQNNTSIAGIVLTIALVGIVLSVLIGVFVGVKKGI